MSSPRTAAAKTAQKTTHKTARNHIQHIYDKLGVSTRTGRPPCSPCNMV